MVELIMAIAASGLIALALVGNMAETSRFSDSGQNQLLAAAIVQEQIDNARNTSFATLQSWVQGEPYKLLVNKESLAEIGPLPNPRPLMLDLVNLNWSNVGQTNKFSGEVFETISYDFVHTDMIRVKVECKWKEGSQNRSYTLETLVSEHGIHN